MDKLLCKQPRERLFLRVRRTDRENKLSKKVRLSVGSLSPSFLDTWAELSALLLQHPCLSAL